MPCCVCVCASACVRGENVCQCVKPSRPSPCASSSPLPKTSTSTSGWARRWLVAPKWTISSVDFMFSNLLSFSPASQQLFACGACVKREEGKANTVDRGAKKCAVILFDALSTFIGLFARPAAIHFVWFKGFACQIWRYLFFSNTYTHTQAHTSTRLTLGTCLAECFAC